MRSIQLNPAVMASAIATLAVAACLASAPFDFDLVKATEQSRDNPVWYVQYGHARTRSVMRQASAAGIVVSMKHNEGGGGPVAQQYHQRGVAPGVKREEQQVVG